MRSSEEQVKDVKEDVWLPTVCYMCYNYCGIKVHRLNGTVVKVEGDPDNPHDLGRICAKGNASIMSLYDLHRAKVPLKRTNPEKGRGVDPRWLEIGWEEALDTVAERLRRIRSEDPRKLVIATLDFWSFAQAAIFASAFGSPNVWRGGADYFCGNVLHAVTQLTHGTFQKGPDLDYCNYCILIGNQVGFVCNSDAMVMTAKMADARMRGMKLVVVDPICTPAASKANEWIPIRPGTDGALALGMLNVLLNELGIYDGEFLRKYTNGPYLIGPDGHYLRDQNTHKPLIWDPLKGRALPHDSQEAQDPALEGTYSHQGIECWPAFQLLKDHVKKYRPEAVSNITTIPAETIRRIAREFGEAAKIGSKILIDGKELPYRPVAVDFSRGAVAHKHGMLAGLSIQLLNIVVGAMDVPGGLLGSNPVGPFWSPLEGPDGLLMPAPPQAVVESTFPARPVEHPATLDLLELFPVAPYSAPLFVVNMLDPGRYQVPYQPEALLHCRTNFMMTTANPEATAQVLGKIPFMVSIARELNETVEFADIVLPDAHSLERLDPFPNRMARGVVPGPGYWYWEMAQPVAEPPPGVKHWVETILEIADRVGILSDYYVVLNALLGLKEPYKLDPTSKYTWPEIVDRYAKGMFGPERGLDWFKEHGFTKTPKKVEEAYARPFIRPRMPIYLEHFKKAGEEVKRVTGEMEIPWDTSDYQPLPDWKPCPAYEEGDSERDLYVVNYKLPFHTFSYTAGNPWLSELAEHHPYAYNILINSQTAKRKGIRDGDWIWVESGAGLRVKGKAKVTECIHPEAVGIGGAFGHWAAGEPVARGKGVHFNALLPAGLERIDMLSTALDSCVKVKVYTGR